jgi:hypothetical protein
MPEIVILSMLIMTVFVLSASAYNYLYLEESKVKGWLTVLLVVTVDVGLLFLVDCLIKSGRY